jgi:hypothetical protein
VKADLVRLVYASRAHAHCDERMLRDILTKARQDNVAHGITGVLLFDSGVFSQWIEGPATAVDRLWVNLQRDTRHSQVEMISHARIDERAFGQWKMGLSTTPLGPAEQIDGIAHTLVHRLDQIVLIPEKLFKLFDTLSEIQRLQTLRA